MAGALADGGGGGGEDSSSVKAVQKRYEGLVTVRSKAVKGKGAWYWAHLEPILALHVDTGSAKAVKLRCSLCGALFSASNPSRTASEHLKRGTCPNFAATHPHPPPPPPPPISTLATIPTPIPTPTLTPTLTSTLIPTLTSTLTPTLTSTLTVTPTPTLTATSTPLILPGPTKVGTSARKRPRYLPIHTVGPAPTSSGSIPPPRAPPPPPPPPLVLSGGKEDLGALALLEDSVKRLRSSPTTTNAGGKAGGEGPFLTKGQVDEAFGLLADWIYESCGALSFSCVEHPKFRAFLTCVGLPPLGRRFLVGPKLDDKFNEVRIESEERLSDAMFFQLASDGWKKQKGGGGGRGETTTTTTPLINITLNLPNGTTLFRKVVPCNTPSILMSSKAAEDILWECVNETCSPALERCVGIIADANKHCLKALQDMEHKSPWMVNLRCQSRGFCSLLKDLYRRNSLFKSVADDCNRIVALFDSKPLAWSYLQKFLGGHNNGRAKLSKLPCDISSSSASAINQDLSAIAQALQIALTDESFKMTYADDPLWREAVESLLGGSFWLDLDAVSNLAHIIQSTLQELKVEGPSVSQCLPLWEELRTKVKDWCGKYDKEEGPIQQVIERNFEKNYHPAWSAAFVLDPLYLLRDPCGKYLPPFKLLTPEQEKDVDKLVMRLVPQEEAPVALMELLKWRANGLDPLYAKAVQMKEVDPTTGKMKSVTPQSRRLIWETCLSEYKTLSKVAVRLIFLRATTSGFKCNGSIWNWVTRHGNSRLAADKAQKVIFIASHARLDSRDFLTDDDKDTELFLDGNGDTLSDNMFLHHNTAL